MARIAPELIGLDPTELAVVNDRNGPGSSRHAYAKSALDMPCWDLLGK
jgi:L-alanine-DL-glutamate epimerase-like enolase superfamily enzyme